MPSERIQRRIEKLLDEADEAYARQDWELVETTTKSALGLDPENEDALAILAAKARVTGEANPFETASSSASAFQAPNTFADGRYEVGAFLGETVTKQVFQAHDNLLNRDVAFTLLKTNSLDDDARRRLAREAQSIAQLGSHPNIVAVFDLGEHGGQPFMVMELMRGGDLDAMLQAIPDHILPIEQAVSITAQTCQGLEFAHSQGVIHRDIRPGNILLSGDGTAKLGDFGFAVAADQSRISQDGLVVANAEYMAPERASGVQATAQSDLYSLGATLYEMVTGRPPYMGERATAIIEQHLNSTPVPPARHNPLVPSELETLILRLLAKDVSGRPESAAEVLNDLNSIASALRLDSADAGAGPTGRDPRYLRTFVGREPELRTLQSTFDAAMTGHGAVMMVVGEMGIGKTTLCEQIATYATVRGGQSLTGHCFEEGLSSLPYIPFSEILLAYASTVDTETLKQQVGANASDIARIVPEIGHELGVDPSAAADPDEDRYRLMRAVSNFLHNIAASQPLLVVLEDLHDADSSTLEMVNYLAHNVAGSRLMLVGTYRHTEITRSHPLSNVLVQLRRVNEFTSLQLKGLGNSEVHRMLTNIVDRDVPWSLAETICQQTEGNPLFVQEVIRDLVEEGTILHEQDSESTSVARVVAINIPQGLRDVISRRLSRLSPECNHALSIGAVIGREFRLDVLHRMLDMSEDEMYAALEEAQSVAVIQESSGAGPIVSFRFNHSFFRQTLYEDLFTPRRIRLHRQIGEILEDVYAGVIERHAREISEHFSHSSDLETLHKALTYTRMAAEDAISMSAYGEAVRLFTHALDIQEMVSPVDGAERCRFLLALGNAMISAGEPLRTAEETAPEALRLAQSLDDNDLASQSCELALEGLWRYGTALMLGTHQYRNWAELADTYATRKSPARVHADIAMAGVRASEGRTSEEWTLRHDALTTARGLGDPEVLLRAVYACLWPGPQQQHSIKLALAAEFAHHPRTGVSSRTLGLFLWRCGCVFLDSGRRPDAERAWQEMSDLAVQTGDAFASLWKLAAEATLALLDGRHEDAVALGTTMGATAEDMGAELFGTQWRQFLTSRSLIHLGRAGEVVETSAETSGVARSSSPEPEEVLLLAHLGRSEEAQTALNQLMPDDEAGGEADDDLTPAWVLTRLLETAVLLEDRAAASTIAFRLADSADLATADLAFTCVARHLGAAAALLGNSDEALAYLHQALDTATGVRFRPEIALTQLHLAELLVSHRRDEARSYLESAVAEFAAMNMQPSLEQAAALQERIASLDSRAPAYPDGLTRREVEVLGLIAVGKTNQEIADDLYISPHTVIRHVSNIFGKIGSSNRAEAATYYASKNNLLH